MNYIAHKECTLEGKEAQSKNIEDLKSRYQNRQVKSVRMCTGNTDKITKPPQPQTNKSTGFDIAKIVK